MTKTRRQCCGLFVEVLDSVWNCWKCLVAFRWIREVCWKFRIRGVARFRWSSEGDLCDKVGTPVESFEKMCEVSWGGGIVGGVKWVVGVCHISAKRLWKIKKDYEKVWKVWRWGGGDWWKFVESFEKLCEGLGRLFEGFKKIGERLFECVKVEECEIEVACEVWLAPDVLCSFSFFFFVVWFWGIFIDNGTRGVVWLWWCRKVEVV